MRTSTIYVHAGRQPMSLALAMRSGPRLVAAGGYGRPHPTCRRPLPGVLVLKFLLHQLTLQLQHRAPRPGSFDGRNGPHAVLNLC